MIRAIWSLALGLITEVNFNFDIIGLLLCAMYHYQMSWALNNQILTVLGLCIPECCAMFSGVKLSMGLFVLFLSFQIFSTMSMI